MKPIDEIESSAETEPWWWIDYLENEIDPSLEQDLQLLLKCSEEDRDAFENFRLLKEWLTDSDPIGTWPLEARCKNVRVKVMNAIEEMDETKKHATERVPHPLTAPNWR